jgi:hypothetical protein
MHILAFICGGWVHLVGDIALLGAGSLIAWGPSGYVYDEYFEYPSRFAAAFALLPVPLGPGLAGLIVAR